jgi:hypothetical protein
VPAVIGFAPSVRHGGCTELEQMVFGTAVKLALSGLVSNWIVADKLPVVE